MKKQQVKRRSLSLPLELAQQTDDEQGIPGETLQHIKHEYRVELAQHTKDDQGIPGETLRHMKHEGKCLEQIMTVRTDHGGCGRHYQRRDIGISQRFPQGSAPRSESSRTIPTSIDINKTLKTYMASIAPWKQRFQDHKLSEISNSGTTFSSNRREALMLPPHHRGGVVGPEGFRNRNVNQQVLGVLHRDTMPVQSTNKSFPHPHCSLEGATSKEAEHSGANEPHETMQLYRHSVQDRGKTDHEGKPTHQDSDDQEKNQICAFHDLTPCFDEGDPYFPRPFHPAFGCPSHVVASVNIFQDYMDFRQVVGSGRNKIDENGMHQHVATIPLLYPTSISDAQPPIALSARCRHLLDDTSSSVPLLLDGDNIRNVSRHEWPSYNISSVAVPHPCQDRGEQSDMVTLSAAAGPASYVHPRYQLFVPQGHQEESVDWQVTDLGAGEQRITDTWVSATRNDVTSFPTVRSSFASALDVPRCTAGGESNKKKGGNTSRQSSSDDEGGDDSVGQERAVVCNATSPPVKPLNAYNFFYAELRDWIICLSDAERKRFLPDERIDDSNVCCGRNGSLGRKMILNQSSRHLSQHERKGQLLSNHWNKDRKTRRKHRTIHGKVSFNRMNTIVSSEWNALSRYDKEFFKDIASTDKKRYKEQMGEWIVERSIC